MYNTLEGDKIMVGTMCVRTINELAKEVLTIEANSILRLIDGIGENFDQAVEILYNCKGRVIVTGMGKSGLIGKKIAATMSSTGVPKKIIRSLNRREKISKDLSPRLDCSITTGI